MIPSSLVPSAQPSTPKPLLVSETQIRLIGLFVMTAVCLLGAIL